MKIGFDAKRAFFNASGLGNYSRDSISALSLYFPQNEYVLYTPKPEKSNPFYNTSNIIVKSPKRLYHKIFPSLWRIRGICEQLINDKIDIYHGLSNELPKGIEKTDVRTVVTIHDLIFMRYPQFYKPIDRKIYEAKSRYAVQHADVVIAVSRQTKNDLIEFFGVPEKKIEVVYQGCNNIYWQSTGEEKKNEIISKYHIPQEFMLCVGTIEKRKNFLNVIKAKQTGNINFPLVIIGRPTVYFKKIKAYIDHYRIDNIFFIHEVIPNDLPAFYQMAKIFIYPSLFEGFGIPILEALTSKTPVITSKDGCFAEVGGKSSVYIDPENIEELTNAIKTLLEDPSLRDKMIIDGYVHAQQFKHDRIAKNIMAVYEKLM